MEKFKIAICDDDTAHIDIMANAVQKAFKAHDIDVYIETYNSVDNLIARLADYAYDLLFLDIEMPKTSGIDLGKQLRANGNQTPIIYVSSHKEKVFDTFQVRPVCFIRKYEYLSDLKAAVNEFLDQRQKNKGKTLTFQSKLGIITVPLSSIICFEGCKKQQLMNLDGKEESIPVYYSMKNIESTLGDYGFLRIHKGFIVNYRYISRMLADGVELTNGTVLPLSRKKSDIKEKYLQLLKNGGDIVI
jgi:DNA-binding LytR/AlgR family response regulator